MILGVIVANLEENWNIREILIHNARGCCNRFHLWCIIVDAVGDVITCDQKNIWFSPRVKEVLQHYIYQSNT